MYYSKFETSLCDMIIVGDENGIIRLHLDCKKAQPRVFEVDNNWERNRSFFTEEVKQITEYLDGKRQQFDINVNPEGTAFQQMVWDTLLEIPFGQTTTYGAIAVSIKKPNASRAVGMANANNPIPIVIPCHRVVGADGSMTGFAFGVDIKEKLIELER